jgi:formamidopyrimidine-DNA glycosylase
MPELPDLTIFIEALQERILNHSLQCMRIAHPFLLRSAELPLSSVENKKVLELQWIGKRISIGLEDELWLLIQLMITMLRGRLCRIGLTDWDAKMVKVSRRRLLLFGKI